MMRITMIAALMVAAATLPTLAGPVQGVVHGTATVGQGAVQGTAEAGRGLAQGTATVARGTGQATVGVARARQRSSRKPAKAPGAS
jgi:hypothetical protein